MREPPALFPITREVRTSLDMLPETADRSGRGARAWKIMCKLPITEGPCAGKRIAENFPPWQPRLTRLIFGHTDQEGHRVLREVFANVAKKNGKTSFAAALALTKLLMEEEDREQVILVASTKDQAGICFDHMAAMVNADPWLAERFKVVGHTIRYARTNSICIAVPSEMASLVGRNPSMVIIDELWQVAATPKGSRLVNQCRTASVGRSQPLILSISTAPVEKSEGIFAATLAKAQRVISGEEVDPHFLGWICAPPTGLDPAARENWHWSNPSLGYTVDEERLAALMASAQSDPNAMRDFRSQNLNIAPETTSGEAKWLTPEQWAAAADTTITLDVLIAEAISIKIGIDRGGLDDLSAIAVIGRCKGDRFLVWLHQWISQQGYDKRRNTIPYDDFEAAGELTIYPRGTGDIDDIVNVVNAAYGSGKLSLVGIDNYCAPGLTEALTNAGIPEDVVQTVPQAGHLTPAIYQVERWLADDHLRHNGTALMALNVFNAVLTRGRANSVSISKASVVGSDKIDGVAAMLNAVAAHLAKAGDDVGLYMNQDGSVRPLLYLDLG
jgi:phage terminase large subunit-like protein